MRIFAVACTRRKWLNTYRICVFQDDPRIVVRLLSLVPLILSATSFTSATTYLSCSLCSIILPSVTRFGFFPVSMCVCVFYFSVFFFFLMRIPLWFDFNVTLGLVFIFFYLIVWRVCMIAFPYCRCN